MRSRSTCVGKPSGEAIAAGSGSVAELFLDSVLIGWNMGGLRSAPGIGAHIL